MLHRPLQSSGLPVLLALSALGVPPTSRGQAAEGNRVGAESPTRGEAMVSTRTFLVLHYDFQGGSDATVRDVSGRGNHGTIRGGAQHVNGDYGTALSLDGVDDHVDCGVAEDLDIGAAGSVLLWFRPETPPQGGLAAWTAGEEKGGQRLVLSLDTSFENRGRGREEFRELGVYMGDGENVLPVHRSNFHKAFFPTPGEWLFLAVTFDGRSVDIYRDGEHTLARFQALTPDLSDASLRIGRCSVGGGRNGYFRGLIADVRVYTAALSPPEVHSVYMETARGRGKDTSGFGTVTARPVVCPEAGRVVADLDYRGLAGARADVTMEAELVDAGGRVVRRGEVRLLPAWGRAEARFDVRDLPAGELVVRVRPSVGGPSLTRVDWPGRAKGWEKVRVLNNLCWELLDEKPAGRRRDFYAFTCPREGWVVFRTEADGDVELTVAGAAPPVVRASGGESSQETMRWLPRGEHSVTVRGIGSLRRLLVRAIPSLVFSHYPHVGPGTGSDHEFLAEHVLPHVNTLNTGGYSPGRNPSGFGLEWARELGRRAWHIRYKASLLQSKLSDDTAEAQIREFLTTSIGLRRPEYHGIILDEFDPGNDTQAWVKSYYDEWIRAYRSVCADPAFAGRMVIPYYGYNVHDYEKSAAFVRTCIEHGSHIANEVYLDVRATEDRAWIYLNEALAGMVPAWRRTWPDAIEHMVVVLSYLEREYWDPHADFNVYLDMQFEHLATRPEFFGLAGIEVYTSHHSNEEYVRSAARLLRHYGIEGRGERLTTTPYGLRHIRNGDFTTGTEGWAVHPAETGSMAVKRHKGYGLLQERYPYRPYTATSFLWTRRSAERPNTFSQEIRGLQPGGLYSLRINTGDYQELVNGASAEQKHAVSITLDNVDEVTDWYRTAMYDGSTQVRTTWRTVGPFSGKNRYCLNVHRRVFRARGATARLTVSDWLSPDDSGGAAGQELAFNFVQVAPYVGN